jgi:uncharacterized protein (UPF0332 family)
VTEEVRLHLEEADACLAQAELLLTSPHPGGAVSRAYYAMFHAASAALLHRDIKRRSHQEIIAAFGQTFAKTGAINARFHKHFAKAFDLRQESDYRPGARVTEALAREILDFAREFVAVCRTLCE